MSEDAGGSDGLRIDSWLWRTRFFKTRSKAATAVRGGAVHVNGDRTRCSRVIRLGDTLQITHPSGRFDIAVVGLPDRRGPAAEAQACYQVNEHVPVARRSHLTSGGQASVGPMRRPDKKSRRQLRKLKGR